jgi:3-dehydroquinate synthase
VTQSVKVKLGARSYDIVIGKHLLEDAGHRIAALGLGNHGIVISDSNVQPLYGSRLADALSASGLVVNVISVRAGESSKSLREAERLYEHMIALGVERDSFVVALGGGVIGDLAGFVAATFMRGVPYVQAPTTLLAQVDSSVGGKVGVNLPQGKNLVGAFYQPRLVIADLDTLESLPLREWRAGFAEVIKHGAIRDAKFFEFLESNRKAIFAKQENVVAQTVRRCCEIKAAVVSEDERESGLRSILNFGHTVGHALEALGEYEGLLHGEAISIGMSVATEISVRHAGLPREQAKRLRKLLADSGLPTQLPEKFGTREILEKVKFDKKVRDGRIRLILLKQLGETVIADDVTESQLAEAIDVCR